MIRAGTIITAHICEIRNVSCGGAIIDIPILDIPGTESMVRCLLEEGANAAALDARGMTPLAHAAQNGNLSAVRVLLKVKTIGTGSSG